MTSFVPVSNDNNGLWTSMYLMGQCFRYQLEKTPQVKENAWKYFMGLKLLNDATGIKVGVVFLLVLVCEFFSK